jgi:ER membrane protein complex subunit 3
LGADVLLDQILTGILRHYATVLMQTTPKKLDAKAVREQCASPPPKKKTLSVSAYSLLYPIRRSLARGINLRSNASVLSPQSFQARKTYLISSFHSGTFLKEPENKGKPPPNPMTDPAGMEAMMGMMRGNMAMMIPQTLIMSWINAFFSGFIISM